MADTERKHVGRRELLAVLGAGIGAALASCGSSPASPSTNGCGAAGDYSEYSQPGFDGTGQTFMPGLQTTDANGQVTFTTIYPGWYAGRATHIHIEVFVNGASVKTTQTAFPESTSASIYTTGAALTIGV